MVMAQPKELVSFLEAYPPDVRETFLAARALLLKRLAPIVELHYYATSAVCAGFSYTGDLRGNFVNLAAYSDHVTLVFMWGVRLPDPQGRLKGGGKQVRHLRLAGVETLDDPYVAKLVAKASENAPRPEGKVRHAIVAKIYEGPKRRPKPAATTSRVKANAKIPKKATSRLKAP